MARNRNPESAPRRRLAVALCVGAVLISAPGWAGNEDPEDLIRQGVALRKRHEDAKAHGYFQRAYDIAHTPRTAAQLGLSKLAIDSFADAELLLSEALETTDPWVAEHRAELEQSRAMARTRLGKVKIDGAPPGATVIVDERPVGHLPRDGVLWVTPGPVRLKIQAPGYLPFARDETVAAGATRHVRVVAAPVPLAPGNAPKPEEAMRVGESSDAVGSQSSGGEPAAVVGLRAAPPVDAPVREGGWRGPVFWGAAVGAVALLGFGVYETLHFHSTLADFNDAHRTPVCGQSGSKVAGGPACERLASDLDLAQALAIVGYIGGGVLAITALIVKLTEPQPEPAPDPSVAISCAPWIVTAGGVSCSLKF